MNDQAGATMNDQAGKLEYYWIRLAIFPNGPWFVAGWHPITKQWWMGGVLPYDNDDIVETGPRILPPDQQAPASDPHLAMLNAGEADRALDKTEFTPGEWQAWKAPDGVWTVWTKYVDDQGRMRTSWPAICNAGGQNNEANARLFAQAKAMRDVILRLLDVCDRAEPGAFHNGVTGVFDEAQAVLRRADGVIK